MTTETILKKLEALKVLDGMIPNKSKRYTYDRAMVVEAKHINKLIFDIKKSTKK